MTETGLLAAMDAADVEAGGTDHLFVVLYNELHRVAERELRRSSPLTLGPTTLLHETFLSFSKRDTAVFENRSHFMVYVARAMRGLIIDYSRRRQAHKRGGQFEITPLPTELPITAEDDLQIDRLAEALESLGQIDARLAECVDLKFFCGLSFGEIANLRAVSERTVQRDWDKARLLLNRLLKDDAHALQLLP